jgi:hypothetical protein
MDDEGEVVELFEPQALNSAQSSTAPKATRDRDILRSP